MAYYPETLFYTYDALTAPGSGTMLSTYQPPQLVTKNYAMFVTVASGNTSVTVALQGSIDATNWSKIITDQVITGNTTAHFSVTNTPVKYIRPVFVSEVGGTDAIVTFSVSAST